MANSKQAEKRNRQRDRRRDNNRLIVGAMRTAMKKARAALQSGAPEAAERLRTAVSRIDKAVQKGVVKRTTASRLISRLSRVRAES